MMGPVSRKEKVWVRNWVANMAAAYNATCPLVSLAIAVGCSKAPSVGVALMLIIACGGMISEPILVPGDLKFPPQLHLGEVSNDIGVLVINTDVRLHVKAVTITMVG
jgi:hypothetical protein